MAQQVLQQTATIAAGTLPAAPATVALPFDNWQIEAIDLEVHAGPAGDLGFRLSNNGQPWLPRSAGEWLVWDDHVERFPTDGYPTASGWEVTGYNVGEHAHAVVVRFHVNTVPVGVARQETPTVITFIEHGVPANVITL